MAYVNFYVGGFLAGLIVPHDNGFAIAIVEKIEDLVSILFLPIVGSSRSSASQYQQLMFLPVLVFHSFGFANKPWTAQHWYRLGFRRVDLPRCFRFQIHILWGRGLFQRLQLERSGCNWLAYELQRVCYLTLLLSICTHDDCTGWSN